MVHDSLRGKLKPIDSETVTDTCLQREWILGIGLLKSSGNVDDE